MTMHYYEVIPVQVSCCKCESLIKFVRMLDDSITELHITEYFLKCNMKLINMT